MLRMAQDSAAGKMFYCYRDNNLYESKLLTEAAGLTGVKYPVVSAVGAGGKTTTLRRLADEYVQSGNTGYCDDYNTYGSRRQAMVSD